MKVLYANGVVSSCTSKLKAPDLCSVINTAKNPVEREREREREREMGPGAFWGTRVMEIVKKHDSGGLVWKRIKLTTTRKANAKKRLLRVWQVLPFSLSHFIRVYLLYHSL